ncbi:uncharacterized protein [Hetaerina americana]|uniref:uncharacterized protein n=1 Tax=Hetaerina americana TaxID=62018 RepID=UPI003A7F5D85
MSFGRSAPCARAILPVAVPPVTLRLIIVLASAGSAAAMIGANLRFGSGSTAANATGNATRVFQCHPGGTTEAAVIFALGALGMAANILLMALILAKRQLRRWSQGLLFHQAVVDCARAALLLPLGVSIHRCQPVSKCSLVETAFLLLVTVSTINMLTTVLNDSPVFPDDQEEDEEEDAPLLMDSPQCVMFGTFMIWFASITINLGPTFLSGALAANSETGANAPGCPLVHGPFRHYVLNVLWIIINALCVGLTLYHLRKLHRDLTKANVEAVRVAGLVTTMISVTAGARGSAAPAPPCGLPVNPHRRIRNYIRRVEREGVERVRMFVVITVAYVVFWGPLFLVTLATPGGGGGGSGRQGRQRVHDSGANLLGHEFTLHVAYVHAFVNPTLFLCLHKGLRRAGLSVLCCLCCPCASASASARRRLSGARPPPPPPRAFLPPPPPLLDRPPSMDGGTPVLLPPAAAVGAPPAPQKAPRTASASLLLPDDREKATQLPETTDSSLSDDHCIEIDFHYDS